MYLFINAISKNSKFILFDKKNKIVDKVSVKIHGKESENLFKYIEKLLKKNELDFSKIDWITVINWPWGFTGTRTLSLVINTIFYLYKTKIDVFDYFKFLELSGAIYPIAIKANKREYLIKEDCKKMPYLSNIDNIKPWNYFWIWDNIDFENKDISIKSWEDYKTFFKNYTFDWKLQKIEPYYIKQPNITI